MNNNKSQQVNKEQEPQICIELDDGVVQLSVAEFNYILDREVTNFILKTDTDEDIITPDIMPNAQVWKIKYQELENRAKILGNIIDRLKKDLEKDKFAQPVRCMSSFSQCVSITKKTKMDNDHENSNKEPQEITLPDIENVSISKNQINDNGHVLKMKTNATQTLNDGECSSTTKHKRKSGLKSKFNDDTVAFNAKNKETVGKKLRLNECEVTNNKNSNTKKLENCNSVKKLEVPKKLNHNFLLKSSNLKYPPPYPYIPPFNNQPSWKKLPPIPNMSIKTSGNKIILTWNLNLTLRTAEIKKYELFVCKETNAPPNISMWKKQRNIDAKVLPMACELEVFALGYIYHLALRAVDVHNRCAPFAVIKTKI